MKYIKVRGINGLMINMFGVRVVLWLFLVIPVTAAYAQDQSVQEKNFDQEINEGVALMNNGAFQQADAEFRAVLASVKTVPADLCFYFGKNSYHLKKYKQSIDWLTKYIELKGSYGSFYDQATEYIELAKDGMKLTADNNSSNTETTTTSKKKPDIDCAEHPYVTCPVCEGDGVIVQQGRLGSSVYKTCPYSDEYGRMTCKDYQLYVKGQLIK